MLPQENSSSAGSFSNLVPDTTSTESKPTPPSSPAAITQMPRGTFAAKFCAHYHITMEHYEDTVLERTLYPVARHLQTFLAVRANYFAPDRDFVRGVGRSTRMRDFEQEVQDYVHDPANRGFLRKTLGLRISTRRMRRIAHELLDHGAPVDQPELSQAPFALPQSRAQ